jgi:hypothetical protein
VLGWQSSAGVPGNVVRSNVRYGLMKAKTIVAAGAVAATIVLVGGGAGSETVAAIRTTNQARELDTAVGSLPAGAERRQQRLFDLLARDGVGCCSPRKCAASSACRFPTSSC